MSESKLAPDRLDLVWFTGTDAVRFLNDLISQEIASVSPGTVVRSLLLEPRGKLSHLLWVLRGDDRVGLLTDGGRGGELATTLGRYRIRVDVEIGDPLSGWLVLGGEDAEAGVWEEGESGVVAGLPWNGPALSFRTGPRPDLPEVAAEEMARIRIQAIEPRFGVDVDLSTIPQESGLVPTTVSFTKGCYLGQELVARIDSRGHVNRHLRVLEFEGNPAPGSEIYDGEELVGKVTTVSNGVGMAMLRREVVPGSHVRVAGLDALVRQ